MIQSFATVLKSVWDSVKDFSDRGVHGSIELNFQAGTLKSLTKKEVVKVD